MNELEIHPCSICQDVRGVEILYSFGEIPVGGYLEGTESAARDALRLESAVAICTRCGLVQQAYDHARDLLESKVYSQYQATYGIAGEVGAYLERFLSRAIETARITEDSGILEIGSNDGSGLRWLSSKGYKVAGFEPAAPLTEACIADGLTVVGDYFDARSASEFVSDHWPADLIYTRHTLEHAPSPLSFLEGIASAMPAHGFAVIEVPYLYLQMLNGQFQSLTFQHESFFTVTSILNALQMAELRAESVEFVSMDGGSMVVSVRHREFGGTEGDHRIDDIVRFERTLQLGITSGYDEFFSSVDRTRGQIREHVLDLAGRGCLVVGYGAGGKGQALVNMCGLDAASMPYIIDEVPGNIGKYVPGTANCVVGPADGRAKHAGAALITAPTHVAAIHAKLAARTAGLRVLATAPGFHYVTGSLEGAEE